VQPEPRSARRPCSRPWRANLWHVIGLEQTIKQWAILQEWRRKHLDQEIASGILVGALGARSTAGPLKIIGL
jgi:hypothetical protein